MLYQDKMKTGLTAIMCDAMTITSKNTGFELPDKDCTYTFPNEENEDSDNSEIPTGLQYYKIRDSNEQRSESEVWVLIEHEQDNPNNVRIIDSGDRDGFALETFGDTLDGIISFPDKIENWNITHIDRKSFEQAKFSEIMKLPDELLVLDDYSLKQSVFSGEATFPEKLEIIGIQALRDSRFTGGLDTLPNVREIREDAFQESTFEQDTDLLELGKNSDELILSEGSLGKYQPTGTIKLPSNIQSIGVTGNSNGNGAFDSSKITGIDFSEVTDLQEIGDNAFKDARIRGSLKIPTTVQAIGENAFYNSVITELDLSDNKELTLIGDNSFIKSKITKLVLPTDSKLNKIGKDAFKESNIEELDLSEAQNLEEIGDGAFENSRLSGILFLPDSVRIVGDYAFYEARFSNSNWKLPLNIEYIGNYSFRNSTFRGVFDAGQSTKLKYIGDNAFSLSYSLGSLSNEIGKKANENKSEYNIKHYINLPNSVEYIGSNAFSQAHFTGNFYMPVSIKYIGGYAFTHSFEEFTIEHSNFNYVLDIENFKRYNSYRLDYSEQSEFKFNENIEYIGANAFQKAHFKDVSSVVPYKLHTIGNDAFKHSFGTNTPIIIYNRPTYRNDVMYHSTETSTAFRRQNIKVGKALTNTLMKNIEIVD